MITKSIKTSEFWAVALASAPYMLQAFLQALGVDLGDQEVSVIVEGAKTTADKILEAADKIDQAHYQQGQSVPYLLFAALGYAGLRTWLKAKGAALSAPQVEEVVREVTAKMKAEDGA